MVGEGNNDGSTGAATVATTYEGDAVVVCVDMWDSVTKKGGLGMDGPHSGIGSVTAHKIAVIQQLREEVDAAGIAAWLVKDLGDGVMVVFPTSEVPPLTPGGLREPSAASETALRFAVKVVLSASGAGPLQSNAIAVSFGPVHLSVAGTHSGTPSLLGYTAVLGVRGYPVDVASRLVAVATENQVLLCTALREQLASSVISIGDGCPVVVDPTEREVRLPASADPMSWERVTAYQLARRDAQDELFGLLGEGRPAPITNRHARLAEQARLSASLGILQDGWSDAAESFESMAEEPREKRNRLASELDQMAKRIVKTRLLVAEVGAGEELAESDIAVRMDEVSEAVDVVDGLLPAAGRSSARGVTEESLEAMAEAAAGISDLMHDARDACQQAIAKGQSRIGPIPFGGARI